MTQRPNQTLQYNPENQMTAVTGNVSAAFVYDGDGNRVLSTINGVTTAYIGSHTEWNVSTQELTRYYLAGSQRVAFRVIKSGQPDKVYYLLADHLGSSSVVMQVDGSVETQTYTSWGELRTGGISSTKRQYTGQINESSLGLYFYNARYYDAYLGRWLQPDTIIPSKSGNCSPLAMDYHETKFLEQLNQENRGRTDNSQTTLPTIPANPLAFDRYTYSFNNPLIYSDPDGHFAFLVPLLAGALIGGGVSTAAYLIAAKASGQDPTWAGAAGALAGGAVAGAVSVIATPLAGTILGTIGVSATGTALVAGTAAINAAGGAVSYLAGGYTQNAIDTAIGEAPTFKPTVGGALFNAGIAGVLSPAVGYKWPVANNTMSTLSQASHFMPGRTVGTLISTQNARNLYKQATISVGIGAYAGNKYAEWE